MPRIANDREKLLQTARKIRHLEATRPHSVRVALHVFLKGRSGPHRLPPFERIYKVNPRKDPESRAVRAELFVKAVIEAQKANSAVPPEALEITLNEYKVL